MGVYRTLYAQLPCARCGVARDVDVQFKTDDDDAMDCYQLGDVARDLDPGEYGGSADAYCDACEARWNIDDQVVSMDLIADRVAAGTLVMRPCTTVKRVGAIGFDVVPTGPPLDAEAVRAFARRLDSVVGMPTEMRLSRADMSLWEGDICRAPYDYDTKLHGTYDWWRAHDAEVAALLRERGWRHGRDFHAELVVSVDGERRVWLGPLS